MKPSLSQKELAFISKLELKEKYFFTRDDIRDNFASSNEMNVYLYRLKKKNRIIKLNKAKYFLVPIKAVGQKWSEYPFILIDEIMNGKDYCIAGKAAAHYWKLIDQIPFEFLVFTPKKYGVMKIFNIRINFKRKRKKNFPKTVKRKIQSHKFIIATKKESLQWK
jgi:predicted transcriptional regulator of viral defense system